MDRPIQVHGLKDLQRDLRAIDRDLVKELSKANKDAADMIRGRAEARAMTTAVLQAKAARRGMRSARSARSVKIVLDAVKVPFILGAEFGAKQWKQFPPWRGNAWQPDRGSGVGYFLHPTIRATRDEFIEVYGKAIDRITRRAFPGGR